MCDPITGTILAVASAATATISQIEQSKSAKAQNKAIDEQLANSYRQIADAEVAERNDRARAARREQARIKIAAGEAGLSLGAGSIETLLMDTLMQTQLSNERTSQNAKNLRREIEGQASQMYSQVHEPSLLSAGLQIGSAGLSGWATGKAIEIRKGTAKSGETSSTLPTGRKGPPA